MRILSWLGALTLLLFSVVPSACMRFSPAPSSSQFVETHTRVWVVRVSGGTEQQMEVVHPVIEGDELVGFVDGQYQQVPLREVLRVGTR